MTFTVVIPARYTSSRLPGKPLCMIAGKPMILHVAEQAARSAAARVCVATDDERIVAVCEAAGVQAFMTSAQHPSGTDRIAEVCRRLGLQGDDILINVQGDEPLLPPAVIDQLAGNMVSQPQAGMASLYELIRDEAEVFNPNVVKVVCDERNMALYFSRAPLPYPRDGFSAQTAYKRHVGIYAYRASVLEAFVSWQPSLPEQVEKLEQLRALGHGVDIHMAEACERIPAGIDTAEDLSRVRYLLEQ